MHDSDAQNISWAHYIVSERGPAFMLRLTSRKLRQTPGEADDKMKGHFISFDEPLQVHEIQIQVCTLRAFELV